MTGLNEKKDTSKTSEQRSKHFQEQEKRRHEICLQAMNGPKIRYESSNEPGRFLKYLKEYGIPKWESLSQKGGNGTHYAKKMLEKTQNLVDNFSA